MLRMIFVLSIVAFGTVASIYSPFDALLFYLWNAYFRPDEWTYGGLIASLNLSLIIGGYLVIATTVSAPKLRVNLRTVLLGLFFIQTLVATIYSEHPTWSWNNWVLFAKVLVVCYVIILLTTDNARYRLVLVIIALSLGFETAKQGWAQLFIAPGSQNNNTIAFLGDNNGVALGTMMLVPVLAALAQTASRRWEKLLHRFFLIGVFMRGITTYSRGGFVAAAVVGLFALIRSPRKLRTLIGVAVVAMLVYTVMPQRFWDRMNTINASNEEMDSSAAGRLHFWTIAQSMAAAKPLTGVGFNGFNPSYEAYNGPGEFGGERAAHSIWFGTLADLGYPGFALFVSILVLSIVSCWRVARQCSKDPTKRDLYLYANALMTSLVAFAAAGTFLSSQYNEMYWHFVALSATLQILAAKQEQTAELPSALLVPQPTLTGAS